MSSTNKELKAGEVKCGGGGFEDELTWKYGLKSMKCLL